MEEGRIHTATHCMASHTPLCCCQIAACAVAWVPAMHHHLVWRTQWHTLARVIIITVWMPVRPCVPRCCCDVYCHREGREEERQLGHDAMTRVVVVAAGCEHHVAWWHQQTTQHSKGKGRGGAATRTVTHPPPLSHQHKQAATSLELVARGRWCGCVKHASPSPSPPTPTHT